MSVDMLSVRSRTNLGQTPEHLSLAAQRDGHRGGRDCGFRSGARLGEALERSAALGEAIRPCCGERVSTGWESHRSEAVPARRTPVQTGGFTAYRLPSLTRSSSQWYDLHGLDELTLVNFCASVSTAEKEVLPC